VRTRRVSGSVRRAPAVGRLQYAAEERADHRRHHHAADDDADHRRRAVAIVEIADHRASDGKTRRRADGLHDARRDHLRQRVGENAGGVRDHHQQQSAEDHRPPAELVGQRADNQLRARKSDEIERDRQLRDGDVLAKPRGKRRQRRHDRLHRHRPEAAHGDQQDEESGRNGLCRRALRRDRTGLDCLVSHCNAIPD
jgi:hypothetical protein